MLGNSLSLTAQNRRASRVSFDLVSGSYIAPQITINRSGAATVFDPSGTLDDAPPNTPRLAYDPVTLTQQGVYLEQASTNLMPYSTADEDRWSVSGATTSALSLAALGRFDGVEIMSKGKSFHRLNSSICQVDVGQPYYLTVFFRPGSSSTGRITMRSSASGYQATLQGTIGNWSQSSASAGTLTILQNDTLYDGTIRLIIQFDALYSDTYKVGLGPHSTTVGESIILIAMQLETGAPSSYIPSLALPQNRGAESLHIQGMTGLYDLTATYENGTVQTLTGCDLTPGYTLAPSEQILVKLTAHRS